MDRIPDLVVYPETEEQVTKLVEAGKKHEVSLIPYGGGTNVTDALLDDYIAGIDAMAARVTTAASDLGAVKSRIDLQKDFVKALMDAIDRGIGQLVDADMNAESTRLQALQVQQQLGIQALSIANANSQNILALFR